MNRASPHGASQAPDEKPGPAPWRAVVIDRDLLSGSYLAKRRKYLRRRPIGIESRIGLVAVVVQTPVATGDCYRVRSPIEYIVGQPRPRPFAEYLLERHDDDRHAF